MAKLKYRNRPVLAKKIEDEEPALPIARPFNPWRIPKTDRARSVVADVINQVQNYEEYYRSRQRRRKDADQLVFEATISAILCDLIHHHLSSRDGGVFITRSHQILGRKTRYRPLAYGKSLPAILDCLATIEMSFITQELGIRNPFDPHRRTIVGPGPSLLSRIEDHGLTFEDLDRSQDQEVIVLKETKEDHWDEGELKEYIDTPEVAHYRKQMHDINGWLIEANLNFDEAVELNGKVVDVNERRLRRVFTRGRFDSGGRLFGGFWQNLTKKERWEGVDIQNEQAVELDYGQLSPRLLYGLCGAQLPSGDLYVLPGLETHRSGIKKLMNAMMFATKRLSRMPKGIRLELSEHHRVGHVMAAIEEAHAPIKGRFFTGIGHAIQFLESQLLVALLLTLRDKGIVALPIHDAVMIPASKKETVKGIMLSLFHEHTHVEGLVREEGQSRG